jgi:hypothetical protein
MRASFFVLAPVALFALACAGRAASTPETHVSGTVALTTYPTTPHTIVATNEKGTALSAPLAANGSFSMALPKGHKYRLAVATSAGAVPIVFPRTSGSLDAAFSVKSKGGVVGLGTVHYLASAPPGGFKVASANAATPAPSSGADCQDCANDDHEVSCSDGQQGHDDGAGGATDANDHADANQEMSLAEHNAPDDVEGCDDEANGDNNNDTNQSEQGAH